MTRLTQRSSVSVIQEVRNLIEQEDSHAHKMSFSVYWKYLSQSPGFCLNFGVLLLAVTPFVVFGYLRLFIASWASLPLTEQQYPNNKNLFIILSVTMIVIAGIFAFLVGAVFLHLSNSQHNAMLKRVAYAPMALFNSNPLGRIINRFSKDTAMADSVVTSQMLVWF